MADCGNNTFAWRPEPEGCKEQTLYFIDPKNGEVHQISTRSSGPGETPSYWPQPTTLSSTSSSSALTVPTSSSTITSSTTSTHAATAAATSTPSPEQPPPSGLSAGAGAGIGIGCVAAIAGVVLVTWLWRCERRKRRLLQEQVSQQGFILDGPPMYEQEPPSKTMYAHVHAQGSTPEPPPQELEDRQRGEVEGTARNEAP